MVAKQRAEKAAARRLAAAAVIRRSVCLRPPFEAGPPQDDHPLGTLRATCSVLRCGAPVLARGVRPLLVRRLRPGAGEIPAAVLLPRLTGCLVRLFAGVVARLVGWRLDRMVAAGGPWRRPGRGGRRSGCGRRRRSGWGGSARGPGRLGPRRWRLRRRR